MPSLALVALLLEISAAYVQAPICFPPSCLIDENCADSIHGRSAKCCGGHCVPTPLPAIRLVNQDCTSRDILVGKEVCAGFCRVNGVCGSTGKCEALLGVGCNCTKYTECMSYLCAYNNVTGDNRTVCRPNLATQAHGQLCFTDLECVSGVCAGGPPGTCRGMLTAENCTDDEQCVAGNICLRGVSCALPCQIGTTTCCSRDADCLGGSGSRLLGWNNKSTYCDTLTGTCTAVVAAGQPCTMTAQCGDNYVCATTCIGAPVVCNGPKTCQALRSLLPGAICPIDVANLCPVWCLHVDRSADANTGICYGPGVVSDGGKCEIPSTICKAPATICSQTTIGDFQYYCKAAGSAALGALCSSSLTPNECPPTMTCYYNVSAPAQPSMCTQRIPIGGACFDSGVECETGLLCYDLASSSALNCDTAAGGCTCNAPIAAGVKCASPGVCVVNSTCTQKLTGVQICAPWFTKADGEQCNITNECKGPNSRCYTPSSLGGGNYTCKPIEGSDCNYPYDCGSQPMWDCTCRRKCTLLNPPTPAPTAAPTVTGPCDAKQAAWYAVRPFRFAFDVYSLGEYDFSYDSALYYAALLDNATLAVYLDFLCCTTCAPGTIPFETRLDRGFQLDCATKSLSILTQVVQAASG